MTGLPPRPGTDRPAAKELHTGCFAPASVRINAAIAQMCHFDKVRVPYVQGLVAQSGHQTSGAGDPARGIVRTRNPLLRSVRGNLARTILSSSVPTRKT